MTWTTQKGSLPMAVHPRPISWIAVSVGGLALFLILGCSVLVSYPIGSTVRGYFYGVTSSEKLDLPVSPGFQSSVDLRCNGNLDVANKTLPSDEDVVNRNTQSDSNVQIPSTDGSTDLSYKSLSPQSSSKVSTNSSSLSIASEVEGMKNLTAPVPVMSSGVTPDKEAKDIATSSNATENGEAGNFDLLTNSKSAYMTPNNNTKSEAARDLSPLPNNGSSTPSGGAGCDLYQGSWIHDLSGPLYTNNSCPVLTQMQNCQGNGRPDKDYENWRWKPYQCDLPRFDAKKFLELMRGKTIAFIGDSVARNQMESLLCILWQVEAPINRGNKKMQRFFFKSTSTSVVRIWSSWLVKQTSEPVDFAQEGIVKLHLDAPDDNFMQYTPSFNVIVLSSGHWFAKQSVYVLNNEIVGGQLWWPDKSRPMKVNNIEAFGISVETILTALATNPNYTGLTIVRSYSPDHYEGGAWNTGGSCTGKERPLGAGELVENGFTKIMHEKQVAGFNRAIEKVAGHRSKLRLMDITEAFGYRHDGHPGPYRSPDPNKITKRGPDGRPPPQDCLHWCMPGPVDSWNEFVLEIIRREFEKQIISS